VKVTLCPTLAVGGAVTETVTVPLLPDDAPYVNCTAFEAELFAYAVTLTVPEPEGTVIVHDAVEEQFTFEAAVEPKSKIVPPGTKPDPVAVTVSPAAAVLGLTCLMLTVPVDEL
jgi:hypothetical protein